MTKETYTLQVAGVTRELPIIALNDALCIASFVILGDAEIVKKSAPLLVERLPEIDVIVTAEAKGIPLAHEVANELGFGTYYVARKSVKAYMDSPVIKKVNSITTTDEQILCFDAKDAAAIKGKRVALIDDVISTGESIEALAQLVALAGGEVVAKAAILAEGDAKLREDIIFLEELPLFTK
ncbi:adenine phosphoribosyltransferase [Lysinibacillus alkalisoli]|uniref:Adenine phosphoribosyltransferase n=1 Tax=Lysinibacillus alkalisoli TaxID=1911548 RepID=A0A917G773_9BACI|nr:phosphoribosyltransferase family protein [Lysinibacillus alkalisoli]GGG26176.1 adenine phosphoribosyltransferase [Lysinibacillus alkalisoli]